jgi:hypothetical protein
MTRSNSPHSPKTVDPRDLEPLLDAAHRAADKMKREYDRRQPGVDADECWTECEALWDGLLLFLTLTNR